MSLLSKCFMLVLVNNHNDNDNSALPSSSHINSNSNNNNEDSNGVWWPAWVFENYRQLSMFCDRYELMGNHFDEYLQASEQYPDVLQRRIAYLIGHPLPTAVGQRRTVYSPFCTKPVRSIDNKLNAAQSQHQGWLEACAEGARRSQAAGVKEEDDKEERVPAAAVLAQAQPLLEAVAVACALPPLLPATASWVAEEEEEKSSAAPVLDQVQAPLEALAVAQAQPPITVAAVVARAQPPLPTTASSLPVTRSTTLDDMTDKPVEPGRDPAAATTTEGTLNFITPSTTADELKRKRPTQTDEDEERPTQTDEDDFFGFTKPRRSPNTFDDFFSFSKPRRLPKTSHIAKRSSFGVVNDLVDSDDNLHRSIIRRKGLKKLHKKSDDE